MMDTETPESSDFHSAPMRQGIGHAGQKAIDRGLRVYVSQLRKSVRNSANQL